MDGVAIGRGQRLDLDCRELVAFCSHLAQKASRVLDEAAAERGVGRQATDQRFNVSMRHAKWDCGPRSRSSGEPASANRPRNCLSALDLSGRADATPPAER
jgi:hypothetical protein